MGSEDESAGVNLAVQQENAVTGMESVLISISGADHPDLVPTILRVLADHQADVFDLGLSVLHERVNLALVAGLPSGEARAPVLKDVLFRAHELGLTARFDPLDPDRWARWNERRASTRWIVTVLAREIDAAHMARVTEIVSHHGMQVDALRRLSDGLNRTEAEPAAADGRASVEIALRGEPADPQALRSEFLSTAADLGIDIAFQRDDVYRRNRRLVAFDMDSTLIETEVIDELARRKGVGEQVSAITERAMRGEIDFTQSFRERVALLEGLDADVLEEVAAALPLTEGVEQLMSNLKRLGYRTAILSGGFRYFGARLQQRLGIDYMHANELEVVDGRATGKVLGPVVDGARKAELLQQIARDEGISLDQVIAVGDGANDLPMLSIAGLGIAFRAKPVVRESAGQAISALGLDGILYLLGFTDADLR